MNKFKPHIIPVYPPHNETIFEEWVSLLGDDIQSGYGRYLIPIHFTSYHVNNDYGNNQEARKDLQNYCDNLDPSKKYFTICQYDDGVGVDWKGKDVLEFNMSKTNGVMLPLLCQPHPYKFKGGKKWFSNFVGSMTHPIREGAKKLQGQEGYFISFENMPIETYCRILHESMFTLCYRGYGSNSFRISEAVQYGSIPVYISDEFIIPPWMNFEEFGVLIKSEDADRVDEILQSIDIGDVIKKQDKLAEVYEEYFSYEANLRHILRYLEMYDAPKT